MAVTEDGTLRQNVRQNRPNYSDTRKYNSQRNSDSQNSQNSQNVQSKKTNFENKNHVRSSGYGKQSVTPKTGPPGATPHPTGVIPKTATAVAPVEKKTQSQSSNISKSVEKPIAMAQADKSNREKVKNPPLIIKPASETQNEQPSTSSAIPPIQIINDLNDPEKSSLNILQETLKVPMWKDYKVFGDRFIMDWLKKSPVSSISKNVKIYEKSKGFEQIKSLPELFRIVENSVKPKDKVIIGFGEETVFVPKFDLDEFTLNLRKLVDNLISINQAEQVVICTIMPDMSRMNNSYYTKELKNLNSRLWMMKKTKKEMFILDLWALVSDRYRLQKEDKRNLVVVKSSGILETIPKVLTKEEVPMIDSKMNYLISEHIDLTDEEKKARKKKISKSTLNEQSLIDATINDEILNHESTILMISDSFQQEIDELIQAEADAVELATADETADSSSVAEDLNSSEDLAPVEASE